MGRAVLGSRILFERPTYLSQRSRLTKSFPLRIHRKRKPLTISDTVSRSSFPCVRNVFFFSIRRVEVRLRAFRDLRARRPPWCSPATDGARMQGGSSGIVYGGLKYQASLLEPSRTVSRRGAPLTLAPHSCRRGASPTCARPPGRPPSSPEPSVSRRRTRCVSWRRGGGLSAPTRLLPSTLALPCVLQQFEQL